jgi:putative selenate reductase
MSDRFRPLSPIQVASWIFDELEADGTVFGVPRELVFEPSPSHRFRTTLFGHPLDTPVGVAAGPHTQLAPNIVVAWLCGARVIELKTVQTIDQLDIPKPCIDMQDEGYNVEWSQELTIDQSLEQYLLAWILVHALHRTFGFPGDRPGVVFNLSVGYDLDGMRQPNMRRFLETVTAPGEHLQRLVEELSGRVPEILNTDLPPSFVDNVTLSTMHGCPPQEVGSIARLLMEEWGLHTSIKFNPTLLGAEDVRRILHDVLGYREVIVPDDAFDHDLQLDVALSLIDELRDVARACDLRFGAKLANTLEVVNHRSVFSPDQHRMYLSGRPLHALVVQLASRLVDGVGDELELSFAGGADAFNVVDLLTAGLRPVTSCSDLLRPGGYLRLRQYLDNIESAMDRAGADNLDDLAMIAASLRQPGVNTLRDAIRGNLARYADRVLKDSDLAKDRFDRSRTKTARSLGFFDCVQAPCTDECDLKQNVPEYMRLVRSGDLAGAAAVIRGDNPLAAILGRACHHACEQPCLRTHLDDPLAIREIKRYVTDHEPAPMPSMATARTAARVAVVGGGPCGVSAASFLARSGVPVTVFEARPFTGGMVSGTIPGYRASPAAIDQDLARVAALGVEVQTGIRVGADLTLDSLRDAGFEHIVVAVGAQRGRRLDIPGETGVGVWDGLEFLRAAREGSVVGIEGTVLVIGGGDAAMDCARTARRLGASKVTVLYRRSGDEMPAHKEELRGLLEEGLQLREQVIPVEVVTGTSAPISLRCRRTRPGEQDASGRSRPVEVAGSEFELAADVVIVAIGQQPDLSVFGDEPVVVNEAGYVDVDPGSLETSVPNVYAGGDIIGDGPASIVKAAGDGRTIASAILARISVDGVISDVSTTPEVDRTELVVRRAHRQFRLVTPRLPTSDRSSFAEVVQTLSDHQAVVEAGRCLDCDLMCSTCEWVCPNRAIFTFATGTLPKELPILIRRGAAVGIESTEPFPITQPLQVALLADLCNECGNCTTFCPTSGSPHRDKPRLYLEFTDFEAKNDNAFRVERAAGRWTIRGRFAGVSHVLTSDERLRYSTDALTVDLDPVTLELQQASVARKTATGVVSLRPFAALWVLLRGISESCPWLPTAPPANHGQ